MELDLVALLPHAVTGVAAGLIAWGGVRIELRWHRQMIDGLRYNVHDPKNPRNLVAVAQNHESRLAVIERGEVRPLRD